MAFQRFDIARLAATPWKNGGGTTREVACWPPGAGLDDFAWRISIATIAAGGPFSAFPGIDRSITLLDGPGVRLSSPDGAIEHRLDAPLAPFAFPGDVPLACELLGGTSSDFNVMVRRGRLKAQVCVVRQPQAIAPAAHGMVLALRGTWAVRLGPRGGEPVHCTAQQGLWWADLPQGAELSPEGADAVLLAVRMDPNL